MVAVTQYFGFSTAAGVAVRSLFEPTTPALPQCHARPIVLLHGFAAHSRVLLPLERYLRKTLKRPVVRVALGPGFGSIRQLAQHVHEQLDAIVPRDDFSGDVDGNSDSGADLDSELSSNLNSNVNYVDIVGHSMGGLVAAYLLKRIDRGRRIRRVVTLGTPHQGTPAAVLGVLAFGLVSRAIWQMLPHSPFVRELHSLPVPVGSQLVSIAADADPLVSVRSARVARRPRHQNAKVQRANHWELLLSQSVFGRVRRALI